MADSARGVKITGKERNLRGETVRPTKVWTLSPVCRKSIGDEESIADKVSCCCDGGTKPGTSPEKIMQTKRFFRLLDFTCIGSETVKLRRRG